MQGLRNFESTHLPQMWPVFNSQTRRHMQVEFVGSPLCSERFFSWVLRLSPLLKNLHFLKHLIRKCQCTLSQGNRAEFNHLKNLVNRERKSCRAKCYECQLSNASRSVPKQGSGKKSRYLVEWKGPLAHEMTCLSLSIT